MRLEILCVATLTCLVGRVAYAQQPPPGPSEEETAIEAVEDTPDPSRPPPRGKGVVWGVVQSRRDRETLVDAIVSVLGRPEKTTTDADGRSRLVLPPGTDQVRVQAELHKAARVKNVRSMLGRVA
jgi:hypothetical protein